jgi:transposase-like protein
MTAKFDARDLSAALNQLRQQAGEDSTANPSESAPLPDREWQRREELKVKMIEARVKLKLMRDRTDELKQALARFRANQGVMRA